MGRVYSEIRGMAIALVCRLDRVALSLFPPILSMLLVGSAQAVQLPSSVDSVETKAAVALIRINEQSVIRESLPDTFLGFNIRWSRFQKDLWDEQNDRVRQKIIDALVPFTGALYRYPGGLVANEYLWESAVLPMQERKRIGIGLPASRKPPLFGLHEFFEFVHKV